MKTYQLRGLAEGLYGKSSIKASNVNEVLNKFEPDARKKMAVTDKEVSAFCACDG